MSLNCISSRGTLERKRWKKAFTLLVIFTKLSRHISLTANIYGRIERKCELTSIRHYCNVNQRKQNLIDESKKSRSIKRLFRFKKYPDEAVKRVCLSSNQIIRSDRVNPSLLCLLQIMQKCASFVDE